MEKMEEENFYNPTRGKLNFNQVLEEMVKYIHQKPEKFYEVVVGCDSSSEEGPNFPIAIVILRKREGGRFFLKKVRYQKRKFPSWKQRILEEVILSCQLALSLKEELRKRVKTENWEFRYIHADIGENGITRDMIREVIGLIRGNGFEAKIKPESFAASIVADRYT